MGSRNQNLFFCYGVGKSEQFWLQHGCGVARRADGAALPLVVQLQDFGPCSSVGRSARRSRASLYYEGQRECDRSPRNPTTMQQLNLLGFADPITKNQILVTGSQNKLLVMGPEQRSCCTWPLRRLPHKNRPSPVATLCGSRKVSKDIHPPA